MATKKTGAAHTRVLADNEYIRHFHKQMDAFTSHNHWQVYTDFLQLATDCFLSNRTPEHPREKHYLEIMRKYDGKAQKYFGEMLGCVMGYMRDTNRECLSEMWEEYAANAHLGQFFTPWSVCQFLAKTQLQFADWEQYTPEKKCYISDPSCGGGRTLVAALKEVPAHKMDSVCFHGIDVDSNVCYVAALNMLFFNANSYIVHGNALTLEVWHVYRTIHHWTGGSIVEITDPEEMKRIITWGLSEKKDTAETAVKTAVKSQGKKTPANDTPMTETAVKTAENGNKSDLQGQLLLFEM